MKNIIEICKEFGFEIPAEKAAEFNRIVAENYKTAAEHEKKISKLETERDALRERAETAEETLKGFEGIDPGKVQEEINSWKLRAEKAEQDYSAKLEQRDFDDALKAEIDGYRFTSEAAKKSVIAEIRAAGLNVKNGKILGLSDLISQIKNNDASAFVDEQQAQAEANKARLALPMNNGSAGKTITKADIMAVRDPVQRQKLIGENTHLFMKGKTE